MNWNEKEIVYLKDNYPKNIRIEEIARSLGRTVISIRRKARKMSLSRKRFVSNIPKLPRKVTDRRYYEKNKEEIYKRKMNRRWRLKSELIELLGSKCQICGYNRSNAALEFHHNKSNKEFSIGVLLKGSSRQKLLKEARKCILLCANCHREVHHEGL